MRIAAIVLTKNEERHIVRCLQSLAGFADEVFVVDSGSSDRTIDLAKSHGATVLANPWRNYATQFNWGLDNAPITADWVMRIDADEFLAPGSGEELRRTVAAAPSNVTGIVIRRQIHFLGRWIRHGAIYPIYHLRLWRRAYGRCEERWMDEHIELSQGETRVVAADIIDANLNSVTWWTEKHNSYASREAVDILRQRYESAGSREGARKLSVQQASL
ncbi:MAG TPA: glycosyltransferase family 2 protein, partial [Usitatibacter sp.]|nr:glycosyltransferase family 2 protein [Usitatibacter sp.]